MDGRPLEAQGEEEERPIPGYLATLPKPNKDGLDRTLLAERRAELASVQVDALKARIDRPVNPDKEPNERALTPLEKIKLAKEKRRQLQAQKTLVAKRPADEDDDIFAEAGRDYDVTSSKSPDKGGAPTAVKSVSSTLLGLDHVASPTKEEEKTKPSDHLQDSAYLLEAELGRRAGEMGQFAYESGDSENEETIDMAAYKSGYTKEELAQEDKKEQRKEKRDQRGYQGNREKHAFQKVARMMEDKYGDKVESKEKKHKKQKR